MRLEVCGWKCEVGSVRLEVCGWKCAVGSVRSEVCAGRKGDRAYAQTTTQNQSDRRPPSLPRSALLPHTSPVFQSPCGEEVMKATGEYLDELDGEVSIPLRGRGNESARDKSARVGRQPFQSPCGEEVMKDASWMVPTGTNMVSIPLRGRGNESSPGNVWRRDMGSFNPLAGKR